MIELLRSGRVDRIHLRKPDAPREVYEALIRAIPSDLYDRLVLHDHFDLAVQYGLGGVHLNRRNPEPPTGWQGWVGRSCHSLEEVMAYKATCSYVSLSPIFDSVSKVGYKQAFTEVELREAVKSGIIDHKVYALGGITFDRLPQVESMGFGGAMILGDAWKSYLP